MTTATKPLVRQIDTLQHALTSQRLSEERSEKMYNEKIGRPILCYRETLPSYENSLILYLAVLESKLLSAKQKEIADKDLHRAMQVQVNEALEKWQTAKHENHNLLMQLEQEKCHSQNLEQARKK